MVVTFRKTPKDKSLRNGSALAPILRLKPRRFSTDESGVAAMEFAIIAPLILGVYLGLAELAMVLSVERQVSHSASVAGDLATQTTQLQAGDSADLVSAVLRVAGIDDLQNYTLHMESFERDSDGNTTSLGEVVYNSGGESFLPDIDVDGLEDNMLSDRSGIVVARVAYRYAPLGLVNTNNKNKDTFLPGTVTLSDTFLLKPRRSTTVPVGDSVGTVISCSGSPESVGCTAS